IYRLLPLHSIHLVKPLAYDFNRRAITLDLHLNLGIREGFRNSFLHLFLHHTYLSIAVTHVGLRYVTQIRRVPCDI